MFVYWSCNLKQVWQSWEEGQFHTIQNGMPLALAHQNRGKRHRVYHQHSTHTLRSKFVFLFWRKIQEEFTHTLMSLQALVALCTSLDTKLFWSYAFWLLNGHADTNVESGVNSGTISHAKCCQAFFQFFSNLQDKILEGRKPGFKVGICLSSTAIHSSFTVVKGVYLAVTMTTQVWAKHGMKQNGGNWKLAITGIAPREIKHGESHQGLPRWTYSALTTRQPPAFTILHQPQSSIITRFPTTAGKSTQERAARVRACNSNRSP